MLILQHVLHYNYSNNAITKIEYGDNATTIYYSTPTRFVEQNNTIYFSEFTGEGTEVAKIGILKDNLLFRHTFYGNASNFLTSSVIELNPKFNDTYQKIGLFNTSKKIAYVYPIFTQAAYGKNGFYDYYADRCDSTCLTVGIPKEIHGTYSSSIRAAAILSLLNYPRITDVDIDKNPDILKNYDRIIVLHNEYVTRKEFNAITNYTDVVYLFPNSLYAEVNVDYNNNVIKLVKGHGYPNKNIGNGFDWKFDNTKYEYDIICDNWIFYKIDNGKMLNCYPSFRMYVDQDLLTELKK